MSLSREQLEAAIFKEYLEDHSLEMGLQAYTVYGKKNTLIRFLKWLKDRQLNVDSCREWVRHLNHIGYQPESIKHEVRVLRATVRYLASKGYVQDFASLIPSPKVPKRVPEVVSAELAERVVIAGTECGPGDNCINQGRKEEHRQALRFVLRTGLRSRELRDLKGSDINLDNETYLVKGKNGNTECMPLPKDMISEVSKRIERAKLFAVTAETLNKSLIRGCRRLGVKTKITLHILRHIFGASLYNQGVPIQEVSWLMRHADIRVTVNTYGHFTLDQLSHSLNSRHPLIREGLSPEEVFRIIQNAVVSTGVKSDKRFNTSVISNRRWMSMKFSLIE